MPKVFITRQEKLNKKLTAWIYGEMQVNRVTQEQLAEAIGIKQPSFNRKLKKGKYTFEDLTAIFQLLPPDANELLRLMGVKE